MKKNNSSKGFSIVEVALVFVVVAIISLLGWTFLNKQSTNDTPNTDIINNPIVEDKLPEVNSNEDLQSAEDALNAIDIDKEIDTSDIEASLE